MPDPELNTKPQLAWSWDKALGPADARPRGEEQDSGHPPLCRVQLHDGTVGPGAFDAAPLFCFIFKFTLFPDFFKGFFS